MARLLARAFLTIWLTRFCILKAIGHIISAFCEASKTGLVRLTKLAFLKWLRPALPKCQTRPSCFLLIAAMMLPVRWYLLALKAAARFLSRSRRLLRHHHLPARDVMLLAGIQAALPC